jgi:hypothetical protein
MKARRPDLPGQDVQSFYVVPRDWGDSADGEGVKPGDG